VTAQLPEADEHDEGDDDREDHHQLQQQPDQSEHRLEQHGHGGEGGPQGQEDEDHHSTTEPGKQAPATGGRQLQPLRQHCMYMIGLESYREHATPPRWSHEK
jgi:hypothetical protein